LKLAKGILIGLVVLVGGAQFVRPDRTNPPAANPYPIDDPQVESIVRRSCFDCHSNETKWPWYSEVAPASWLLANHVKDGRRHMNFSDWDREKEPKRLEELCEEVREGNMPMPSYLLIHRGAVLSADEVNTLCTWSKARLASTAGPIPDHDDEKSEH